MKRSVCTALSVLLLLAMLCASLAGCKKETPKNPAPGTAATETDTGDGGLDAVDYGGAKLKFLTYKEGDSIATANELDGDFNGGPVEKGVYTRNSVLEEKYNVTFTHTDMRANDSRIVERVGMLFNAGSEDIDYVLAGTMNTNSCGIRGYTLAAQDVPFLRTEGDWWYSDFLEATEIKGKNFFLMGDFAYTSWTMTTCIMFNETMAEKWGIDPEEIFTLIRDGRWTLDRMIAYSKQVYEDTDRSGDVSLGDTFGFASNSACVDALLGGCDIRFVTKDGDGNMVYGVEDRFYTFFDMIYDLAHTKSSCYSDAEESFGKYDRNTFPSMMEQNQALFSVNGLPFRDSGMRNVEFRYLYLPTPKWNETQSKYYSWCHQYNSSSVAVMRGTDHLEMLGRVLEDFTYYSRQYVRPAYYDTLLEGIMSKSPVFVEMLDYIIGSYSIDLASLFVNEKITLLAGSTGDIRTMVNKANKGSIKTKLLRNAQTWQGILDGISTSVAGK